MHDIFIEFLKQDLDYEQSSFDITRISSSFDKQAELAKSFA